LPLGARRPGWHHVSIDREFPQNWLGFDSYLPQWHWIFAVSDRDLPLNLNSFASVLEIALVAVSQKN